MLPSIARTAALLAQVIPVDRVVADYLDRGLLGMTALLSLAGMVFLYFRLEKRDAALLRITRECQTEKEGLAREHQTAVTALVREHQTALLTAQATIAAVQEKRVTDAERYAQASLASTSEVISTMNNLDANLAGSQRASEEVRDALRDSALGENGSLVRTISALTARVDRLVTPNPGGRR